MCMCVRTRESTFSWRLKKSSMMHGVRTGSLHRAVSLSVNDRVDCIVCISPAAKGGDPKISDIVFLSLDYSSLGCI